MGTQKKRGVGTQEANRGLELRRKGQGEPRRKVGGNPGEKGIGTQETGGTQGNRGELRRKMGWELRRKWGGYSGVRGDSGE